MHIKYVAVLNPATPGAMVVKNHINTTFEIDKYKYVDYYKYFKLYDYMNMKKQQQNVFLFILSLMKKAYN